MKSWSKLLYSWPCQVVAILASLWISVQLGPLLTLTGLGSLATLKLLFYAPLLVYCALNFGLPLAVLVMSVFSAKSQGNQLALAETGMGMLVIKHWQTLNLLLLLVYSTTFVILRVAAAWKLAVILRTLER